ncbi:OF BC1 COMPLEX KINASE 7, chloroplastic [Seminavis robusta]|uniref:OF BC1 COMPLEX KINASE 7, chloroplastic n=1 Tax=Seminavis robusta TaxID=568900 RepID=A0A9N8DDH8_9STRA|nr:OF BC1 COMPLEX KINASE 7, chloroplastic [Seminavis robusta]|eukprot:Sro69_g038480.1 OF BC1 COMPLEX KINASE 7, chloroplastic (738) ;mRNA; f:33686-36091
MRFSVLLGVSLFIIAAQIPFAGGFSIATSTAVNLRTGNSCQLQFTIPPPERTTFRFTPSIVRHTYQPPKANTLQPLRTSLTLQDEQIKISSWRKRRRNFLQSTRLAVGVLFALTTVSSNTAWAASSAAAATTSSPSLLGSLWGKRTLPIARTCRKIIKLSLLSFLMIRWLRLQKRLSLDPTSEWSRYANHPGARGRALGSLVCLQIFPLWLVTRVLQLCKRKELAERIRTRTGNVFADGLLKLGPLYIKMGQILSCRDNLLPPAWITAMEKLQDQVPSRRGRDALELAYEAMGGKDEFNRVFSDFDPEPLAAASLGQVHKAVLHDNVRIKGKDDETNGVVAVKIQRAKLREIYDQDLVVMNKLAAFMDKMGGIKSNVGGVSQSWTDIFSDAEEILYREIDYRDEATNARRFADDFGLDIGGKPLKRQSSSSAAVDHSKIATSKDGEPLPSAASWIRTPYVYTDLSTEKVLVMEFVPSIKITNKAKLDAANVTMEEREYLSDMLARSYLRQFCCNLFFSTDPHPGNLGVELLDRRTRTSKDSRRVRLVFYDFGQAASLNVNQADGILDIMEAIIDLDVERSVDAFQTMGVLNEDANLDLVRAKVAENYRTGKVKANQKKLKRKGYQSTRGDSTAAKAMSSNATTAVSEETPASTKDSDVMKFFSLPAEYAFVARALSQMDGVGKTLDSDFDFVSSAAPYIVEIKGATKYLKDELKKRWSNFVTELRSPYGKVNKLTKV